MLHTFTATGFSPKIRGRNLEVNFKIGTGTCTVRMYHLDGVTVQTIKKTNYSSAPDAVTFTEDDTPRFTSFVVRDWDVECTAFTSAVSFEAVGDESEAPHG